MKKIKIVKDGPYIVQGDIPLVEREITPDGNSYKLVDKEVYKTGKVYTLCRCGKSKNPPFCDGQHAKENFDGAETCNKLNFLERAQKITGAEIDMYDDGRCALARFCHRPNGDAWELVESSDIPQNKEQAIIAASECTAGRLVVCDKQGNNLNFKYQPEIEILQDPENNVSGPIGVKGSVELQSSDGTIYPKQERYALCRCGYSKNKPFCDCSHVPYGFVDNE
ncbi:MAG: iron-binding protein [Clostridiales bacterium]|nr:iron-binding protein [Clostridiales bacterium]